ncbi:MAG TPA: hypothetical protein VJH92_01070 [Candidatus Nanoarchaeia archaeon]|nr:hypothetical protein [Candidatus Nanoarchaeia archaeon]
MSRLQDIFDGGKDIDREEFRDEKPRIFYEQERQILNGMGEEYFPPARDISKEKEAPSKSEDYIIYAPSKSKKISKEKLYGNVQDLSKHLFLTPHHEDKIFYKQNEIIKTKNTTYMISLESLLTKYKFNSSKKFISRGNVFMGGINLKYDQDTMVNAGNIGEFVLPIVEYIHAIKPDYVIASDRGARLLGLAVFELYRRLHGKFPTSDGTLRFRRFSKSNTKKETEDHLRSLVKDMVAVEDNPTVLVLDDWVCSGGTKVLAEETISRLARQYRGDKVKVDFKFGVLMGAGGDISGHDSKNSGFAGTVDWRDDSNIIGVKYGENWGGSDIKGSAVRSQGSKKYRKRMYKGIRKLTKKINEAEQEKAAA